jgi:ribose 5-phosphate isomerase B
MSMSCSFFHFLRIFVKKRYTTYVCKFVTSCNNYFLNERVFTLKIAISADHGGFRLKNEILPLLQSLGHEVVDFGCECETSVDYPDYALPVCDLVAEGKADRGILICGTGIGMSIAANKRAGIRCALVSDTFSAQATRDHNDTNVLALGERVLGPGLALDIVKIWLETPFSNGERHVNRIKKVMEIEKRYIKGHNPLQA